MVQWWALIITFIVGIFFGVGVIGLLAAGESDEERGWHGEQRTNRYK